jgi:CRISPR-associated protein Csm3
MRLIEYVDFTGRLVLVSGLHIGGSGGTLEIGAVDNTVIRHPLTEEPYIPGTSLKGRLRSGLEALKQNYNQRGEPEVSEPCGCGRCDVCRIFGAHKNPNPDKAPSRLIVRDLPLSQAARDLIDERERQGLSYIEEKTENLINRRTRTAEHPRTSERIDRGISFDLSLTLKIFEGDDRDHDIEYIRHALRLMEKEGLGAKVGGGYGQVEIHALTVTRVDPATLSTPSDVRA